MRLARMVERLSGLAGGIGGLFTLAFFGLALAPAMMLAAVASGVAWIAARQQTAQDHLRRSVAQSMEEICGVAAALVGLAVSAYLLIAPNQGTGQSTTCDALGIC